MQTKVLIKIKGFVQGVGYRYFCYRKAQELDINGYAKNLFDGSVEVCAEGNENFIKDFIKYLKVGPDNADIKTVSVEDLPVDNKYSDFKML